MLNKVRTHEVRDSSMTFRELGSLRHHPRFLCRSPACNGDAGPESSFCPLESFSPHTDLFHSKIPSLPVLFIISLLEIKSIRNVISVRKADWRKALPPISTTVQIATSILTWTWLWPGPAFLDLYIRNSIDLLYPA